MPGRRCILSLARCSFSNQILIHRYLAAESGEVFYAEAPFDRRRCSEFVKENVLPLLDPASCKCTVDDLRVKLHDWLGLVRPSHDDLEICYDYTGDWELFYNAMGGYMPSWCQKRLLGQGNVNELLRYEFHLKNELPEHHALNDAMAIRHAFRELPQSLTE